MTRIGFVLRDPTQIDVPFFRYVTGLPNGDLDVIYTRTDRLADRLFDQELGREISWGMDLLKGYRYSVLPSRARATWLHCELRKRRYDLLVVNGYNERALLAAALAANLTRVRVALRLDTPSFRQEQPAKKALRKALYSAFRVVFDHFLPVGSSAAAFLQVMGVPLGKMSLFPYTVDLDRFRRSPAMSGVARRALRQKYGLPSTGRVVVSVAKFHPRESPWDLLRAYSAMDSPGAHLWLVGDGPERRALEEYARRHCSTGVTFGGYIPYAELPTAYGLADAFVHPARYEPWGVSIQEALACGLPVLASSQVGAARDFVTPGKNGFIYKAGEAGEVRRMFPQLLSLISSPEARAVSERNLAKCEYPRIWATLADVARDRQ